MFNGVYKTPSNDLSGLLFLDMDGVMHPSGCSSKHFGMHIPKLWECLEKYKRPLGIVISSSWRLEMPWEQLCVRLSVLAPQLVGATPMLPRTGFDYPSHVRAQECERWRKQAGYEHLPWRALDDMPDLFESGQSELIVCDGAKGIQQEQIEKLESWLKMLS